MKSLVTNQVLILAFLATSAPYYMLWQYLREVNTDNTDVICLVCKAFLHSWSDLFHILQQPMRKEWCWWASGTLSHCVSEDNKAKGGDFLAQFIVLRPEAQHPYHPGTLLEMQTWAHPRSPEIESAF